MGPEFLVDTMEMIPQSLRRDPQLARNLTGAPTLREPRQNAKFLLGHRGYGRWPLAFVRFRDQLTRHLQHSLDKSFRPLSSVHTPREMHDPPAPGLRIFIHDGGDVHPHSPAG